MVFVLASGGDSDSAPEGDAHINLNASDRLDQRGRAGQPGRDVPAAAKVTNLAAAAKRRAATCACT